jgi:RND family efflux transporter MFP subunit
MTSGQRREARRSPWARTPALLLISVLFLFLGAAGCRPADSRGGAATKYHCPMHPTYVKDRPADCPICNMKLVPVKAQASTSTTPKVATTSSAHVLAGQFYCTMCPEVVTNAPGSCWECNMKLIEKSTEDPPATPFGRVAVMVSPEKQHLIGLKTAPVEERELTRTIRATALVEHDETRYARVAPRFSGWVKTLHVNFTGRTVEQGEPLLTVYSPELLATEQEFLLALRQLDPPPNRPPSAELAAARALLESARQRLLLWQIGPDEIQALERHREPRSELLLRAPFSGHVTAKNAVEGQAFAAGETLFELADLDRLWLRVSVFEADIPFLSVGQTARITFPLLESASREGRIDFLYPHLDPQTRRAEARIPMENPGHALRPNMWANVDLETPLGRGLTIPADAIINTGTRHLAFVLGDDDHLYPRHVELGSRTDDFCLVTGGLQAGDRVVTRALFLIDSESQL